MAKRNPNDQTRAGNILAGAVSGLADDPQAALNKMAKAAAKLNREAYDGQNLVKAARDIAAATRRGEKAAGLVSGGLK